MWSPRDALKHADSHTYKKQNLLELVQYHINPEPRVNVQHSLQDLFPLFINLLPFCISGSAFMSHSHFLFCSFLSNFFFVLPYSVCSSGFLFMGTVKSELPIEWARTRNTQFMTNFPSPAFWKLIQWNEVTKQF